MRSFVKAAVCSLVLAASLISQASFAGGNFPLGPNPQMTPGTVCTRSNTFRYPEHIKYCDRNVDSGLKREIIADYDKQLGYDIRGMDRVQFKIDHYIPLCMGGANDRENLWPQHQSVYDITDPMEPLACQKMAAGVLKQAKAIELIKTGKNDLSQVPAIVHYLESL